MTLNLSAYLIILDHCVVDGITHTELLSALISTVDPVETLTSDQKYVSRIFAGERGFPKTPGTKSCGEPDSTANEGHEEPCSEVAGGLPERGRLTGFGFIFWEIWEISHVSVSLGNLGKSWEKILMQNRFQRRGKQCQNAGKARKNGIFDRFTGNSGAKSSIPQHEAAGLTEKIAGEACLAPTGRAQLLPTP